MNTSLVELPIPHQHSLLSVLLTCTKTIFRPHWVCLDLLRCLNNSRLPTYCSNWSWFRADCFHHYVSWACVRPPKTFLIPYFRKTAFIWSYFRSSSWQCCCKTTPSNCLFHTDLILISVLRPNFLHCWHTMRRVWPGYIQLYEPYFRLKASWSYLCALIWNAETFV